MRYLPSFSLDQYSLIYQQASRPMAAAVGPRGADDATSPGYFLPTPQLSTPEPNYSTYSARLPPITMLHRTPRTTPLVDYNSASDDNESEDERENGDEHVEPSIVVKKSPAAVTNEQVRVEEQYVKFDPVTKSFHHPDCTPPQPIMASVKNMDVEDEEKKAGGGRGPRQSQSMGDLNTTSYAQRRITKNKRDTPHHKSQGRPYGESAAVIIRLMSSVEALYKNASHGRDSLEQPLKEATIQTADLSSVKPPKSKKVKAATRGGGRRSSRTNELPFHKDERDVPDFIKSNDAETGTEGRIYHYKRLDKAIEYYFGEFGVKGDDFTYYEVLRASSTLSSQTRELLGNRKVLKVVARPAPAASIHDMVYVKANVCYPRYKKNMNLFITKGTQPASYAYYASEVLFDIEQMRGFCRGDTVYCPPTMLGLDKTDHAKRVRADKYLQGPGCMDFDVETQDEDDNTYTKAHEQEVKRNLRKFGDVVYHYQKLRVADYDNQWMAKTTVVPATKRQEARRVSDPPASHSTPMDLDETQEELDSEENEVKYDNAANVLMKLSKSNNT